MYDDSFRERYREAPIAISSTENFEPTFPHIHNQIEMLYVEKGTAEIRISNDTFLAQAGDLLVVNPLEVHSVEVMATEVYCHRCICFEQSLIVDPKVVRQLRNGEISIPHFFPASKEITCILAQLFRKLFDAVLQDSAALLFEVSSLVSAIFATLVRHDLLLKNMRGEKESVFCAESLQYIEQHYFEGISSKEIAQAMFYTHSHFCRKFKCIFGVSFSEYLKMYRLLKAKEKLMTENKKVSAIAAECGFYSGNYFAASFKKVFKMTPLQYKNQYSSKIKKTQYNSFCAGIL